MFFLLRIFEFLKAFWILRLFLKIKKALKYNRYEFFSSRFYVEFLISCNVSNYILFIVTFLNSQLVTVFFLFQLLFEISSFYPLKSKDAELTFQRLLQFFRMVSPTGRQSGLSTEDSAWLDVKLKTIEILRSISKFGWLSSHAGGNITPSSTTDSSDVLLHLILDHIADEGNFISF